MKTHRRSQPRRAFYLLREPRFTVPAILMLGLGLGATSAVFSLVNGILLKPLPYAQPDRLVSIREVIPSIAQVYPTLPVNARHFVEWRKASCSGLPDSTRRRLRRRSPGMSGETIGAKYRDELKSLDEKILKIDAFIEVGDLETLRDQLVRLVNQKMDAIDKRIDTRKVAEPLIAQILSENTPKQKLPTETRAPIEKPKVPDISDILQPETIASTLQNSSDTQKPQEVIVSEAAPLLRRKQVNTSSSDPQAEQLQKELLEALDRLEKLDVDST